MAVVLVDGARACTPASGRWPISIVAVAADPTLLVRCRDRHDRDPKAADGGQNPADFLGLSAVGKHDKHVVCGQASQIAVSGFRRMQKV